MNPDPGLTTSDMSEVCIIFEWLEVLMIVPGRPIIWLVVMCVGRSTLVGPGPTGPPKNGRSRRPLEKPEKKVGPVQELKVGQDL